MPLFDVMWSLPAAVAYQIFYCVLETRGFAFWTGPTEEELLARMKQWRM